MILFCVLFTFSLDIWCAIHKVIDLLYFIEDSFQPCLGSGLFARWLSWSKNQDIWYSWLTGKLLSNSTNTGTKLGMFLLPDQIIFICLLSVMWKWSEIYCCGEHTSWKEKMSMGAIFGLGGWSFSLLYIFFLQDPCCTMVVASCFNQGKWRTDFSLS